MCSLINTLNLNGDYNFEAVGFIHSVHSTSISRHNSRVLLWKLDRYLLREDRKKFIGSHNREFRCAISLIRNFSRVKEDCSKIKSSEISFFAILKIISRSLQVV